jgi:hypothetical protein
MGLDFHGFRHSKFFHRNHIHPPLAFETPTPFYHPRRISDEGMNGEH